jgi:hypothetical protein
MSVGSRVAVLSETRIFTRAGTEAAIRIITARARLACLRADHPVAQVVQGILWASIDDTWLDHSRQVMEVLGVALEFWEFVDMSRAAAWDAAQRKRHLQSYKHKVIKPAAEAKEAAWFIAQLSRLNEEGVVDYAEIVPLRQPWPVEMRVVQWGRGRWRQFRAWCLARSSGALPLVVWGAGDLPRMLPVCPFCGAVADLRHILNVRQGTADLREDLRGSAFRDPATWAMRRVGVAAGMEARVQYFGRCMVRIIAARRR